MIINNILRFCDTDFTAFNTYNTSLFYQWTLQKTINISSNITITLMTVQLTKVTIYYQQSTLHLYANEIYEKCNKNSKKTRFFDFSRKIEQLGL